MQLLIDPSDPQFGPMGHRKDPNLPLGCFFSKIGRLCSFKYILVTPHPSQTERDLLLPKESGLRAGLTMAISFRTINVSLV